MHVVHHVNHTIVECIGDPGPPGERGQPGLPGLDGFTGNGCIIVNIFTSKKKSSNSLISGYIMAAHICMF